MKRYERKVYFRLSEEMDRDLNEYAKKNEIKRSRAVRRFISKGLYDGKREFFVKVQKVRHDE